MKTTSTQLFWIGFGILLTFNLIVYSKFYRKKYVMIALFTIGLISGIIGLILLGKPEYEMARGQAATSFFSPIIYIFTYQVLRQIFKKIKGIEPTYEFASSYDNTDRRKLIILDYIVYITPFVLSLISIMIIGWKYKN